MSRFEPLERISSWRRIAGAMWGEARSPQVLGFDDMDFTEINRLCVALRAETGVNITPTHFAVRATAETLRRHPELNVLMVRGKPMRRKDISVFVQVAVKGEGKNVGNADLSGIKIKDADQKTVVQIAQELAERAGRVRKGEDKDIESTKNLLNTIPGSVLGVLMRVIDTAMFDLEMDLSAIGVKPDPFGSAMITNCANFGVHAGFAPLVPMSRTPFLFLLGRTDDKPVVRDGQIVIRPMCRSTATFDHRLLDGYQIGVICNEFKVCMEDPTTMSGALP
jgi:pyruvate/2-oxoglutarate dehydrogenase complex dihydrolipoamide acyltransferase (E2) component